MGKGGALGGAPPLLRLSLSLAPADHQVHPGVPGPDDTGPRPLGDHAARPARASVPDGADPAVRRADARACTAEREPDHPRDAAANRGWRRRWWRWWRWWRGGRGRWGGGGGGGRWGGGGGRRGRGGRGRWGRWRWWRRWWRRWRRRRWWRRWRWW